METIEAIRQRWGCRKYQDKELSKDHLGMVLDAGRFAPSAGNLQDRSFTVVKSHETKEKIVAACGNQTWMQSAPVHIVIVTENKKYKQFFGARGELYAIQDTSFSVENMLLAATELGLGCSLVVGFNEEKLSDILGIKSPAQPHAIITLGYPSEEPKHSDKYPLQKMVFFERYGSRMENEALAYGEYAVLRQQMTAKTATTVSKKANKLVEKLKSLFTRKKTEQPVEDHFMEKTTFEDEEVEIPRMLPRPAHK